MNKKCLLGSILFCLVTGASGNETQTIKDAVERNVPEVSLRPYFVRLLTAIRLAENGGPGREFGVMNSKANNLDKQAGWCAAICWKRYQEFKTGQHGQSYLEYLARRYAPIGVANDPGNLNRNWLKNVKHFMEAI